MANLRFIDRNVAADSFQADQSRRREEGRQDQAQQDQYERTALTALGSGDMTTFDHFSKKAGLNLPPEVVQDANQRRLLAAGTLTAEKFYKDDPQQAQSFVQNYMRSNGNVDQAFTTTGKPRRKPAVELMHIQQGNQQVLAMFDKNAPTGQSPLTIPKDPQGQPIVPALTPGKNTDPAIVKTVKFIQSTFKNPNGSPVSWEAAWNMANLAKANPSLLFQKIYGMHAKAGESTLLAGATQAEVDAVMRQAWQRAQQETQSILQQFGAAPATNPAVAGGAGVGTSGQGTPSPNQPVSRYNPSTGQLGPYSP